MGTRVKVKRFFFGWYYRYKSRRIAKSRIKVRNAGEVLDKLKELEEIKLKFDKTKDKVMQDKVRACLSLMEWVAGR